MEKIINKKIKKALLLGNEAVIRGALEAGVKFVTTYPGTPASEIGDIFAKISQERKIYFEYSANEKVALETAAGAVFSGLPSLVSMKHYGLNVALDSLLPLVYLECPLVVVVTDDPGCWSSIQTEQDSRWISRLGKIPTLEPADSQEAKDMTILAFQLAKKYKIPILVRLTTRVCHTRSMVKLGVLKKINIQGKFIKPSQGFKIGSAQTVHLHQELLKKLKKIKKEFIEKSPLNFLNGPKVKNKEGIGALTSGVCFFYLKEAIQELGLNLPIFKLGVSYPFPEEKITRFIKDLKVLVVVEEIDDILEKEIERIAKDCNPKLKIYGKNTFFESGEMKPEYVLDALQKLIFPRQSASVRVQSASSPRPGRAPNLCAGCPHRATFWMVKQALGEDKIYAGDIGCYLLGALPPLKMSDFIVAMGAGVGLAHGISKATKEKLIIFIGDSTFFHAGLPALVNLVYNQSDVLLIILDNKITAMTGHQPNPGMGITGQGEPTKILKIEEIVKSCQVDYLDMINVYNYQDSLEKIKKAYQSKGVSVVVAKGECRLLAVRKMARQGIALPKFEIIKQSPKLEELKNFGCPAIRKHIRNSYIRNKFVIRSKERSDYYIEQNLCWGCGFCRQLFLENIKLKMNHE